MHRSRALQRLSGHKGDLARCFGVTGLALFGSTGRGDARQDSDLDILAGFDGPAMPERFVGVQFRLEDLPSRPVDLVTDMALRCELQPHLQREVVRV